MFDECIIVMGDTHNDYAKNVMDYDIVDFGIYDISNSEEVLGKQASEIVSLAARRTSDGTKMPNVYG